jgi:chromosome segregation ATPase
MASLVVSGKKLEEAENKIRELELLLSQREMENTMLKEQVQTLSSENKELKKKVEDVLVSIDRKDIEKAKDDLVGKAKGAVDDYFKTLTK